MTQPVPNPRPEGQVPHGLFVRRSGTGAPVVLLHGLGASSRYWDAVAPVDAPFRATMPDLLGFGRSPKPSDASYDIACHVARIAPFVTPGSVLVGHSTGALIAAAAAATHADLVRAVVLIGMPAYETAEEAIRAVTRLGWLAKATAENRVVAHWICNAMCRLRPVAKAAAPLFVRNLPAGVAQDGVMHTWPSYSRTLHNVVLGHRPLPDLIAIKQPVTLLYGTRDAESSTEAVGRLTASLERSNSRANVRIVNGDHHLPIRRPELIRQVILDATTGHSELGVEHDS